MTSDPLMIRLAEAVQRKHDADFALLEIADELREFASRAVGETSRMQKTLNGGLEGIAAIPHLPRGVVPEKREAAE